MRTRENKAYWLHIEGGIKLEKGVKLGAERKEENIFTQGCTKSYHDLSLRK